MNKKSKIDAVNLFTFLKEYARLRHKPVRTLESDGYREVFWIGKVPREIDCSCVLWEGESADDGKPRGVPSDGWLEIRRPERSEPPEPPEEVAPWVNESEWADSKQEVLELFSTIFNPSWVPGIEIEESEEEEVPEKLHLEDFPNIQRAWDIYVKDKWEAWAEEDRRKEDVQECYNHLFRLHRAKLHLGDQYELIMSVGCLHWLDSEEIKRHVLTLPSTVTFDSVNAVVAVHHDGAMADLHLETDMLTLEQQPDELTEKLLNDRKLELGTDVLSEGGKDLLKAMAHGLPTGDGKFVDTIEKVSGSATEIPTIYFSPALILRKRSSQTLIDVCDKIENSLSDEVSVLPPVVRTMVGEMGVENREKGLGGESKNEPIISGEPNEIFFPLPSNDEQKQIINRMGRQTGVLVQGPPGTGKSLTIANLVCHLLANGKKILITSQKTPALKVLKDYLPSSVADLCVLLLGEGQDQQMALQKSVAEITNQYTSFDKVKSTKKINILRKKLDALREQEAKTFETLCILRSKEEDEFPARIGSYRGKLCDIAGKIRAQKAFFAWFSDELPEGMSLLSDKIPSCPVSSSEALTTLSFLRSVSPPDEEKARFIIPANEDLPLPNMVKEMTDNESKLNSSLDSIKHLLKHSAQKVLSKKSVDELREMATQLQEISSLKNALSGKNSGWENEASRQILAGETVIWLELLNTTESLLSKIKDLFPGAGKLEVLGIEKRSRRSVLKDARDLHKHLCDGGKLGLGPFRPAVVKQAGYLVKQITVDGRLCKSSESLNELIGWLNLKEAVGELEEQWQTHVQLDIENIPQNQAIDMFEQETKRLRAVVSIVNKKDAASQKLSEWDPAIVPEWDNTESILALEGLAKALIVDKKLKQIQSWFDSETKKLSSIVKNSDSAPEVEDALMALEGRGYDSYESTYEKIVRLNKTKETIKERNQKILNLKSKLPRLTSDLLGSYEEQKWDSDLGYLDDAWDFKCADAWVLEISEPGAEVLLQEKLISIRDEILQSLTGLATELAWKHCINNMEDSSYSSLMAWKMAIDKLGKGTGKYAERNRANARECLEECRGAVPAWVMPLHRVLDTVKIAPEIFDVVIVDEASQSGPEAIFLSYLAKQMVVVGDDQQIRPDNVGLEQGLAHQLQKRYLKDIPHPEIYDSTESLFGIATVRFGNPVRLREHFRCMPEIIGFSNQISYAAQPLIPLRQFGGDRIQPVLKTTYVEGAFLDLGKGKINKLEAEKVVDAIEQCCDDPKYRGKTMGVISLLNTSHQDRYIEQLIVDRIDPEEIEKRNIICGDAYDFQGDERDIVFMSMVSARSENRRVVAMTGEKARRRFNVAASRAKDQMWLFHSINAGDLNQQCFRRQLINYMNEQRTNPLEGAIAMSLADLHHLATKSIRSNEKPPHPFDSWFEVDVYLDISDRQFSVIPQYEIRGYSIDMVVVGGARKLAIECDGDYWHGPEQYESDLRRQSDLERCGWEFFRIRESTYRYDPENALKNLWKLLGHADFTEKQEVQKDESGKGHLFDDEKNPRKQKSSHKIIGHCTDNQKPKKQPSHQSTQAKSQFEKLQRKVSVKKIPVKPEVNSAEDILSLTNKILGEIIIGILGGLPNNSCKKEAITKHVCQVYGVITRGNPREKIRRKINSAIAVLKRKKHVREYKAKNIRIQLTKLGQSVLVKNPQMDLAFSSGDDSGNGIVEGTIGGDNELVHRVVDLLKNDHCEGTRSEILKV